MKNVFIVFFLLLLSTPAWLYGQSHNVSFIHGLNGDSGSWSFADSYFESLYPINTQRIGYSSNQSISSIASGEYGPLLDNTVVIAHSMGGLVSREMIRTHSDDKIRALITVGTPHTGAAGANLPNSNGVQVLVNAWTNDLLAGPFSLFRNHGYAADIAQAYLSYVVGDIAQILTNDIFGSQSVQDLRPNSSFLQTLNGSSGSTFPSAHYVLWSREDWNMQYRIIDAKDDGVEDGSTMRNAGRAYAVYASIAYQAAAEADYWLYRWTSSGDINAYDNYLYYASVAGGFMNGASAISYYWQMDWNLIVLGTSPTALDSDGVVLESSQAPSFVSSSRRRRMNQSGRPGINHFEQRHNQDALDAINFALTRDDVNVDEVPTALAASISGPGSLTIGQTGTWSANASGGSTPYAYQWDYMLVCPGGLYAEDCDRWHAGGTSATFSKRVSGGFDLRLKLRVTDGSGTDETVYKTVSVSGS